MRGPRGLALTGLCLALAGSASAAPQLEERPKELAHYAKELARREGFEPPTPRFGESRKRKK